MLATDTGNAEALTVRPRRQQLKKRLLVTSTVRFQDGLSFRTQQIPYLSAVTDLDL